jgi:Na+/melibiose symporter-like transporter
MATAYLSDKWGKRAFFLLFWFTVSIIGYILLLAVPLSSPVSAASTSSANESELSIIPSL